MDRRELKFRAFDIESSEMITDFTNPHNELYLDFDEENKLCLFMHIEDDYPEKRDAIIMQFTGFKDLKEVEIFEHDILKGFGQEEKMTVMFENGSFCVYNSFGYWGSLSRLFEIYERYDEEVLVIGNTHNPHKKQ